MTSNHRLCITLLVLFSVCSTCLATASSSDEVTLSRPVIPLSELASALSNPTETLAVSPDFRECKATVALRRANRKEVLAAIAEAFGGEWSPRKDAPRVHELRRHKDVSDWLRSW